MNSYTKEINEIVAEIATLKNYKKSTTTRYKLVLTAYCNFNDMPLSALLNEADLEEEKGVRMKRRKIKKRLLSYREHIQNQGKQVSTINKELSTLLSFYRSQEIEVPRIPQLMNVTHENIHDIPTKKQIQQVLQNTNSLLMQSVILFMASSGCARKEVLSLTIQDFINATEEYHHETEIKQVLQKIKGKYNIIPTFYLIRAKTNYPYFCFCSNEAVQKIVLYLEQRIRNGEQLTGDAQLFNVKPSSITMGFERLNDKMGWGRVNTHRFFHPHVLRKFFATELLKSDLDSMTIDFLSGRRINSTQEAYFKADPRRLKNKYLHVVEAVTFFENVTYISITSKEKEELELLRRSSKEQERRLTELEQLIRKLN